MQKYIFTMMTMRHVVRLCVCVYVGKLRGAGTRIYLKVTPAACIQCQANLSTVDTWNAKDLE